MSLRSDRAVCILSATMFMYAGAAAAQNYPVKPIRIIVPYAPGGSTDVVFRILAPRLTEILGQQAVVENRPGGSSTIGLDIAAKSPPDGYTLGVANITFGANPSLIKKMPFDTEKDLVPVSLTSIVTLVLAVHPSVPARSVKELIALARARPGQLSYGSAGVGTGTHLTGELLRASARIDLLHVPYRGIGPAIGELAGGQISMAFLGLPSGLPQMQAGKVRALGVSSTQRSAVVPQLPTLAESGLPGFESTTWQGFAVPAGTPREIIARLHAETSRALQTPELRNRFSSLGVEPVGSAPEAFARYIKSEMAKWSKLARAIGLPKQ